MKITIILSLIATFLMAQNPKVYSALGDVMYNNVDNITKLQSIDSYQIYDSKIQKYIIDVAASKSVGFSLDEGDKSIDKMAYLKNLRALSKENDFYMRNSKISFESSIKNEDSKLFSKIINTGLIDTQRYKDEIINYYMFHADDINSSGVIQTYLDEDEALRKQRLANMKRYKSKAQLRAEKIKRIRKNDKEKQAAIEKSLQEEVDKKKVEIRKNQKKELSF
jgi:hypothetical protein